jgi:hypothetical protein
MAWAWCEVPSVKSGAVVTNARALDVFGAGEQQINPSAAIQQVVTA